MNYPIDELTLITENLVDGQQIWSDGGISRRNIPIQQVYVLNQHHQLVLSWDISIYEKNASNWWSFKVDAANGKILEQHNFEPRPSLQTLLAADRWARTEMSKWIAA